MVSINKACKKENALGKRNQATLLGWSLGLVGIMSKVEVMLKMGMLKCVTAWARHTDSTQDSKPQNSKPFISVDTKNRPGKLDLILVVHPGVWNFLHLHCITSYICTSYNSFIISHITHHIITRIETSRCEICTISIGSSKCWILYIYLPLI
jgi:hypothetical protein